MPSDSVYGPASFVETERQNKQEIQFYKISLQYGKRKKSMKFG